MPLVLEATGPNGVVQRQPLVSGLARTQADKGVRYRIVDADGKRLEIEATVKRIDDDLLIEGLPGGDVVQIDDFFSRCTPTESCVLSLEGIAAPGPVAEITPATEPLAATREGSFILSSPGGPASQALPVAPEAESSGTGKWIAIGGGVALLGLAGGGGGGGGGGGPPDTTPPAAPRSRTHGCR